MQVVLNLGKALSVLRPGGVHREGRARACEVKAPCRVRDAVSARRAGSPTWRCSSCDG